MLALMLMFTFVFGFTSNISAVVKYSGLSVPEKASVYESALILQRCLVGKVGNVDDAAVRAGNVLGEQNGSEWTVWDKTIINYHQTLSSDDNVMRCSEYDNALVKGAINRLKIDPVDFTCSMGGERRDFNECIGGIGNFKFPSTDGSSNPHKYTESDLVKYLKDTVGIDLNNPGDEVRYWRSYNIVSNFCASSKAITKSVYDKEDDNNRYSFKKPDTGADQYFLASSKKDEKPKYKNTEQGTVDCGTYQNRVGQYYEAYKRYLERLTPEERESEVMATTNASAPPASGEGASSCVIDGIGWIICPVVNFMSGIVDAAYSWVSSLLVVQPLMTTGESSGVYEGWKVMRNIANVAFVIAFMFIIFSQLTGLGVSNYGVKKLLPRVVISAILVNISFWICAIAVDASNIAGASMVTVFDAIKASVQPPEGSIGFVEQGNVWTGLATVALAGVGVYYLMLSAFIPAIIAAAVAIITVFLVLALRHALVILLIIIAPLAFVAFLLPNTEDWFNKWRKLLLTLLLMYPIIAALFGASALASALVMMSAKDNTIVQIMGAAIAILPLAITPIVMKAAGGVLNRFAGIVNNAEKGPADRLKNVARARHANNVSRRNAQALGGAKQLGRGSFVKWRARRNAITQGLKGNETRAQQQYVADAMTNQDGSATNFAQQVAGGSMLSGTKLAETSAGQKVLAQADPAALQRALAGAQFTIEKAELEDIQAEKTAVSGMSSTAEIIAALENPSNSTAKTAALMDRFITIGDAGDKTNSKGQVTQGYASYIDRFASDNDPKNAVLRQSIAKSLGDNGPKFMKGSDLDAIRTGRLGQVIKNDNDEPVLDKDTKKPKVASFSQIARDNSNVYSEENLVSDTNANISYAFDKADAAGKKKMIETAIKLTENPVLRGKIKHNEAAINDLVSKAAEFNVTAPGQQNTTADPTLLQIAKPGQSLHAAATAAGFNTTPGQPQAPAAQPTRPPQAPNAPQPPQSAPDPRDFSNRRPPS